MSSTIELTLEQAPASVLELQLEHTAIELHMAGPSLIELAMAVPGPKGDKGDPGSGGGAGGSYQHTQTVPLDTWVVNHNLGYRPAVSVLTMGGMLMLAEVLHASANQALIYFDQPTAGLAICS